MAYRFASGVAALTLLGAMWVVLALNTLGNARGRHPVERWAAGTVTALLAVLCAVMAAN